MKREIYMYLCEHSESNIHEIAKALNFDEIKTLHYVNELLKGGYIKMEPPIPLSDTNNDSCYYSATNKKYVEE